MSMADRDGVIWYDGKLVPWRNATTHVLTHTLHYGMGVFEGLRAYETDQGPAIFRLPEHTERLFNSAHIFKMPIPFDPATLMQAQKMLYEKIILNPVIFDPLFSMAQKQWGSLQRIYQCMSQLRLGHGALTLDPIVF